MEAIRLRQELEASSVRQSEADHRAGELTAEVLAAAHSLKKGRVRETGTSRPFLSRRRSSRRGSLPFLMNGKGESCQQEDLTAFLQLLLRRFPLKLTGLLSLLSLPTACPGWVIPS